MTNGDDRPDSNQLPGRGAASFLCKAERWMYRHGRPGLAAGFANRGACQER
jgi:hypothetical protein